MKRIILFLLTIVMAKSIIAQQLSSRSYEDVVNGNNISIQWAAQSGILYAGSTNGQINKYDMAAGTNSLYKELGTDKVYSLATDRAGKLFASSNETGYIIDKDQTITLSGHSYKVDDIAVSSVNNLIVTGSRDNSIIIWGADGNKVRKIKAHDDDVVAVCFSPDGELVASSSKDKTVKVWETFTGRLVHTFTSATNLMGDIIFSNDGTKLFAGGSNGIIVSWSTKEWTKLFTLESLPGNLTKLSISRDDQFLAAAGDNTKIGVFDLRSNTKEMLETVLSTTDIQFSPDGKSLAALTTTGQIMVWDFSSRKIGEQKFPASDKKAQLVLSAPQLVERNNNSIVEPGDNAEIKISLNNTGTGRAYDIYLLLAISGNVQDLKVNERIYIGELEAGATITKNVPLELGKNLTTSNATVTVSAVAANNVETAKQSLSFQTKGAGGLAYILVSEPNFYTPEGIVKKGLPITMRYKLRNIGPEAATTTQVKFSLPEHVVAANKLQATYGRIGANTSVEDSLLFYADNSFDGNTIEIKMALTEVTTGQDNNTFTINLGQDLRPKIDTIKLVPAGVKVTDALPQSTSPSMADAGESDFTVDTDIPSAPGKNENKIALVIGNENYREFNTRVEFAANDARIFKEYATRLLGVEQDNLFYLQDATSADIRSAVEKIKKMASLMNGRAEVVIYYSGAVFVDDYFRDEYILPVDLRTNKLDEYFTIQNIVNTLTDPKHQSVTAFIDGTRLFESRLKPLNTGKTPRSFYLYGNASILKATTGNQSAAGNEKLKHGLFTYYLLKKYKLDKTGTDISKLATYTEQQVKLACFKTGLPEQITELKSSK